MNVRLTLGLLIALVVLGIGVYWSELRPGSAPATPTPAVARLFSFEVQDVASLSAAWSGKQVALRKEGDGQWRLTQPEAAAADAPRVDGALARLGTLSASRQLAVKAEELASYGLNPPQGAITVTLATGEQLRQVIGNPTVDKGSFYMRRPTTDAEGTVNIVPAAMVESIRQLVELPPKAAPTPDPAATPETAPTPER